MAISTHFPKTLPEALEIHASARPNALAFIETAPDGTETGVTYAEALAEVELLAARLSAVGVRAGDRVAVRLSKSISAMLLFFAVMRARAVYVPINPDYTNREAGVLIEDSDPTILIDNSAESLPLPENTKIRTLQFGTSALSDLLTVEPGDIPTKPTAEEIASMLFTSGTTGRPKGAPLTHHNLLSNSQSLGEAWNISHEDRLLHVLPAFHGHGLFLGIGMMIAFGATVRLMAKFDVEETIRLMPETTVFMAVPAIYTRLLNCPQLDRTACRNLRLATVGSAPLSQETFEALHSKMGITVVERYGLTETSILTTNPIDGTARAGSVGKPLSCVELRIAGDDNSTLGSGAVGRILVRGPSITNGYWRRPETRDDWTPDGWFDTGDLGQIDQDGFVWLVGRKKDLIISGGFNVYPREVEIELETIEGLAEAVVFGVPHPDFGEGVMAAVRAEAGATLDVLNIQSALADGLAKYKRPKRIVLVDDFPRNHMGKVLKTKLRETYVATFSQEGDEPT